MSHESLNDWRDKLNIIDDSIMSLLGQRYEICRLVALIKKQNNIPMMQPERVKEVVDRCVRRGEQSKVPADLTKNLYQLIIDYACEMETEIIASSS